MLRSNPLKRKPIDKLRIAIYLTVAGTIAFQSYNSIDFDYIILFVWFPLGVLIFWMPPRLDSKALREATAPNAQYRFDRSFRVIALIAVGATGAIPTLIVMILRQEWPETATAIPAFTWATIIVVHAVVARRYFLRLRHRYIETSHQSRLCFACGYDLRGGDPDTCPECGFSYAGSES